MVLPRQSKRNLSSLTRLKGSLGSGDDRATSAGSPAVGTSRTLLEAQGVKAYSFQFVPEVPPSLNDYPGTAVFSLAQLVL